MHRGIDGPAGRRMHLASGANDRRSPSAINRCAAGAVVAAGVVIASSQGVAGHSIGHYPSYYPHEISIETLDPAAAAERLGKKSLQAYVGARPAFSADVPKHAAAVRSLGSFIVLS